MSSVSAYIFFSGNCADAFTRYQEIFGGELNIMRHSEVPEGEEGMPGATPDTVMHASVKVGDTTLMGSDDPSGDGGPKVGMAVAYTAGDADESRRIYDALADGGTAVMPLEKTFWSPAFGVVNDRFGVQWFVDTDTAD